MNADGSNQRAIIPYNGYHDGYASVSPDSTKIAFVSNRDGQEELYVMDFDGSNQTRLTFDNAGSHWPTPKWSPDSTRLTYWTRQQSNDDVFVIYADGSNQTRITESATRDLYPAWGGPRGVETVAIDIKPGSDPNCFNNDGHGVIPVAILGSADFDATRVDPASVQLAGMSVRVVGRGNMQAHSEDVNNDGFIDLVVQIADVDGTFQPGADTAILTGNLYDGTSIEGSDSICIVP